MIKLIGYWADNPSNPMDSVAPHLRPYLNKELWKPDSSNDRYPHPSNLIDPEFWKKNGLKEKIITYLKSGVRCESYYGFSSCRICNKLLGTSERTDFVWCWPDKLEHYIEEHDVRLPEEFLEHAISGHTFPQINQEPCIRPDEKFWIAWGKGQR